MTRGRWSLAILLLVFPGTLGFAGCRPGAEPEEAGGAAADPERQRVLQFWESFGAATRARTGGDCRAAAGLYEKALALDSMHEECLYYLGQCRRELGDPGAARDAFERLVEVSPSSARGHLALGALFASPDPDEPMDLERAERHLRRALEINKEETGPLVRLGEVLLVTGRTEEARAQLEAALQTNEKSVEAALLAGYIAWEDGGREITPLADRVREATRRETPIAGVLGEGDRREGESGAAPPLASPVGRLLFEEPVLALRARAAAGEPLTDDAVLDAWQEVRRLSQEYWRRLEDTPTP